MKLTMLKELKLDELISRRFALEEVNAAFEAMEQRRCHGALRINRITPLFIPHARCETYFQKGADTLSGLSPLSQTTRGTAAGARPPSHREATAASVIRRAGGYGLWAPKSCCLRAWR